MGEAADDEEGDAEEQGEHVVFAGKGDGGGHDEAAGDGEEAAVDDAEVEPALKEGLRGFLHRHGGQAGEGGEGGATDDVAQQDEAEEAEFVFADEAGRAGVECELVVDDGDECKGKDDAGGKVVAVFDSEEAEACDADADAGHEGGAESVEGAHVVVCFCMLTCILAYVAGE